MIIVNEALRSIYKEVADIIKNEIGVVCDVTNIYFVKMPIDQHWSYEAIIEVVIGNKKELISGEYGKHLYAEYRRIENERLKECSDGDFMRVLFVNPEKYANIINWYECLDEVQKHRKTCGIFDSPYKFRDDFNKSKYGSKFTMFYFDKDIKPTIIINCIKMFVNLYGEVEARYIVEYKLRIIDGNRLMQVGTFDNFTDLKVSPTVFDNILKECAKPFTCKSLL